MAQVSLILRKVGGANWLPGVGTDGRSDDDVAATDFYLDADEEVSVWLIEDSRENLPRVVAAIAACRDFLKAVEYVLLPTPDFEGLGIPLMRSDGDTPDKYANETWHRHFTITSHEQAVAIVKAVRAFGQPVHCRKRDVKDLLVRAIHNGDITLDNLKPEVREAVTAAISQQ